jgi:hypothetical protein
MNIQPLLDALYLQENAARAQANDLRTQIGELQTRLREAESHLVHLAITRKTVTGLADRLPAVPPDPPEHPDFPRILAVFNEATGPLRAKDICEALDRNVLPKNIEGTRAKLKRLVELGILTEVDTGSFARKQEPAEPRLASFTSDSSSMAACARKNGGRAGGGDQWALSASPWGEAGAVERATVCGGVRDGVVDGLEAERPDSFGGEIQSARSEEPDDADIG